MCSRVASQRLRVPRFLLHPEGEVPAFMRVPRFPLHREGEVPAFIRRLSEPPQQRIRSASSSQATCEKDVLVQAQIGDQLFQVAVLVLELLQPPQLTHAEPAIELLPTIERLLRDPHPTDHLGHRRPRLRLLQRIGNLFLGVPGLLHGMLLDHGVHDAGKLTLKMDEERGGRHVQKRSRSQKLYRLELRCRELFLAL